jgi:hypothetical protein
MIDLFHGVSLSGALFLAGYRIVVTSPLYVLSAFGTTPVFLAREKSWP